MTYGLLGKFSAQPGSRDDLVAHLLQAAKLLERNSGCIQYIVSTSDEPEAVWVCEVWTNAAAHAASLEPEDIHALILKARPLIAGMSDQIKLTVQGGRACLAENCHLGCCAGRRSCCGSWERRGVRVAARPSPVARALLRAGQAALFEDCGVLATGAGCVTSRHRAAEGLLQHDYIASTRLVNVSCRGPDRSWRLAAVVMPLT